MKREFLESLNLEKEVIDKILAENGNDIEREKAKTLQAKADLADAQAQLTERTKDLEELKKTAGNAEEVQQKLDDLSAKYETDTAKLQKQIEERDYADAMTADIASAGIKFSSKGAEKAFRDELKAKALPLKDGKLDGFEAHLKAARDADPGAFAPERPAASIVHKTGPGGDPGTMSAGALAAQRFNAQYVMTKKE